MGLGLGSGPRRGVVAGARLGDSFELGSGGGLAGASRAAHENKRHESEAAPLAAEIQQLARARAERHPGREWCIDWSAVRDEQRRMQRRARGQRHQTAPVVEDAQIQTHEAHTGGRGGKETHHAGSHFSPRTRLHHSTATHTPRQRTQWCWRRPMPHHRTLSTACCPVDRPAGAPSSS